MRLTSRELATVLAGLRALQGARSRQELEEKVAYLNRQDRLTADEIDGLIGRLQNSDDRDADRPTADQLLGKDEAAYDPNGCASL